VRLNDEDLLKQAMAVGGQRSAAETVAEALREYIQRRTQPLLLELAGSIDYDENYDYKQRRKLR